MCVMHHSDAVRIYVVIVIYGYYISGFSRFRKNKGPRTVVARYINVYFNVSLTCLQQIILYNMCSMFTHRRARNHGHCDAHNKNIISFNRR